MGEKGKVENSVTQAIIALVTCQVYGIYWAWLRVKELNAYLGKQAVNPMLIFPGCICFIALIIGFWQLAKAAAEAEKQAGTSTKDDSILYFILLLLISPVGVWMIQEKLNAVWQK